MSGKENKHNDNTDPSNKIISTVDTTGSVFLNPASAIPVNIAKTATGQVASVRGVVTGTTIVFENVLTK